MNLLNEFGVVELDVNSLKIELGINTDNSFKSVDCSSMYPHPPPVGGWGTCWKCLHLPPTPTWTKKCF